MAKSMVEGFRIGAITDRIQFQQQPGGWQTRTGRIGRITERKDSPGPFNRVAKGPDGRDS